MLSQIGTIALPTETAEKVYYGKPLSAEEIAAGLDEVVVASGPRGPHLAVLREIRPAEPENAPERLAELRERTTGNLQQDLELLFRQAMEQNYGVSINQRRVDDVLLDF